MDEKSRAKAPELSNLKQPGASAREVEYPEEPDHVGELFAEATREWHALSESLYDLKQALEPDDFDAALAHLEIPSLEVITAAWEKAQAESENAVDTQSPAHDEARRDAPDGSSRAQECAAVEAAEHGPPPECQDTKPTPSTIPREESDASSQATSDNNHSAAQIDEEQPTPDKSNDIRERLAELTSLLRKHIANSSEGEDSKSTVEIPEQLTLTIAREVAGRVRDSVLETLRDRGVDAAGSSGSGALACSDADPQSESAPKRIPLEDVEAMIDQLTKLY